MHRFSRTILIALAVFLFSYNFSLATSNYATIFEQAGSQYQVTNSSVTNFSNEYTPSTSIKVCGVGMALANTSTTPDTLTWDIKLYQGGTTPQNGTLLDTIVPDVNEYPTSSTHIQTVFDFNECHILTSGIKYYFTWANKGNTIPWTIGESLSPATIVYPWAQNSGGTWTRYTSFFWDFELTGENNEQITIVHPTDGDPVSTKFGTFWTDLNTIRSSSTIIYVDYATSTANLGSVSTLTGRASYAIPGTGESIWDTRAYVPYPVPFVDGQNYKAIARIYDGLTSKASSTVISFTPSANYSPLPYDLPIGSIGIPTSTSTEMTITCDPNDPLFTRSFCKLFVYLFIPDDASFARFGEIGDLIARKPPFGYISSINTAFNTLSTSTVSSTIDMSAFSGIESIFTDFKTLISWIMWLLFGFWVYNKFRHFKF